MAWSCDSCGRSVTSNPIMCDLCGSAAPGADPTKVALGGQRDLIMEAHLRALAIWQRVGGVLLGVAAVWLVGTSMLTSHEGAFGGTLAAVAMFGAVFCLVLAAGSFVIGHFLARYSNVARIIAGVLTALSAAMQLLRTGALLFMSSGSRYDGGYGDYNYPRHSYYYSYSSGPSGILIVVSLVALIWMIALLWVLFNARSSKICSDRYRDLVAKTPELRPPTFKSPFFVIPAALSGFMILLAMVVILPRLM
jgi:hypothetical protein